MFNASVCYYESTQSHFSTEYLHRTERNILLQTRFFPSKRNEHKHLHNKNKTTTKLLKNPSNTIITFVQLLWVRILETLLCTTLNIKYIRYNLVYTSVKLLYQHDYFNKYKDLLSIGSYKN